ncbi:hypothetical protein GQ457_08G012790 [Hibiscus cannabinus]
MKDDVDLNSQIKKGSRRDFKEIGGSFRSAASVFSKKLQNQRLKKRGNGGGSVRWPVEKPNSRQYRETQSEVADYGFGRRSFVATARTSFDNDPRHSFDDPRASWGKTFPRMPTMVSVLEDSSSSRSVDTAAMVAEMKLVSNSKVSPATVDYLYGPKLNSLRDDYSKESRRRSKAWNIWGLIHRRIVNKEEEEDRCCRANGAGRHGDVRSNTSIFTVEVLLDTDEEQPERRDGRKQGNYCQELTEVVLNLIFTVKR